MANLLIPGYFYDFKEFQEYAPITPGTHHDFGWLFWAQGLSKYAVAANLGMDGLPQLGEYLGGWGNPRTGVMTRSAAAFACGWTTGSYYEAPDTFGRAIEIEKSLELEETSPGVWKIAKADPTWALQYNPINGEGYGNDNDDGTINGWWAFKSKVLSFVYQPGQYMILLTGTSRDLIYINNVLAHHSPGGYYPGNADKRLDFDTLGLTPGEVYPIQIFTAVGDNPVRFHLETNVPIGEEFVIAISHYVQGSGTLVPAAGWATAGFKTVTATPSEGYVLSSLMVNGVPVTSGDTINVTTHQTIAAIFGRDLSSTGACKRDNVIAAALRKCQVLAEGELPTNDQIDTGAEALERFLKHMQTDTEFRWLMTDRTEAIVAGTQTYTLTASRDVLDIYNLFLRDANGQDIPLRTVDSNWYDQTLMNKANSDALPQVAVASFTRDTNTNVASVAITIYPKPSTAYTLHYKAMIKSYNLPTGESELIQDEIWCDVVVYGLAARLADEYLGVERSVYLEQKFEKLKDAAQRKSKPSRDTMLVYPV